MWSFGWKLMLSGFLDRLWMQLYQVVVGKFYNPTTLGQYTRSKEYASIFSSNLTSIVQKVTYPVLSQIQDNQERMVSGYRRIIKITMFVTSIIMINMGAVAEPLIYCLIGPKWHEAAIYLPLICLPASAYPLHAINLNMLKVQGRSDLFLGLEILKKIIAIGPLFIGAFIGIIPMLYTYLLTSFISYLLNSHYSGKLLNYSSWMQMKDVAPSYGTALIVALSIYFLKYIPISYWFILPMQLLMGCAVFFIVCHLIKPEEYSEIKSIIVPLIKK
jgi:O-antigen/teichoic acid export membrane protein